LEIDIHHKTVIQLLLPFLVLHPGLFGGRQCDPPAELRLRSGLYGTVLGLALVEGEAAVCVMVHESDGLHEAQHDRGAHEAHTDTFQLQAETVHGQRWMDAVRHQPVLCARLEVRTHVRRQVSPRRQHALVLVNAVGCTSSCCDVMA
jgi:hypothetical protein